MTTAEAENMVETMAAQLGEHFDAVLIMTSRPSPKDAGTPELMRRSRGNYYASIGMASEFLNDNNAYTMAHHVARKIDR